MTHTEHERLYCEEVFPEKVILNAGIFTTYSQAENVLYARELEGEVGLETVRCGNLYYLICNA